jgi:hypothetical protein
VIDNDSAEAPGTRSGTLRLEVDRRDGDDAAVSMVAAPGLDDVLAAIASLDQRRHTEMTVVDGSGAYLTVGGGRGRYHVYMGAYDHDDRIVLQNAEAVDGAYEELVVDGRLTRYAAGDVVDLDTVTTAVLEFHRSGRPHSDLRWRSA